MLLPSLPPSVLTTLMKNKALVTPAPPAAQPEAKGLPSSSAAETLSAKVAPSEPSEEGRVRTLLLLTVFTLS